MGLLLLRVTAGIVLFVRAFIWLRMEPSLGTLAPAAIAIIGGSLLVAGLWTPIAGSLVAMLGIWNTITLRVDPFAGILMAATGAALALLGPGAWSVDARLFGWKRIDVHKRPN